MTMARVILGEAFVAILVFAVVYAAVSPALQPIVLPRISMPWFTTDPNMITEDYSLIKGTNVSQGIEFVNLNVTSKFGAIYIVFSENPQVVFQATFQHAANTTQLDASASQHAERLQVDAYGEAGGLNLTLGKSCQYNGSLSVRMGGLVMKLGQNTNISKLAVDIRYFGGIYLIIDNGTSFEQLDLNVGVGGLQLNVEAEYLGRSGVIDTYTNIGGLLMGVSVNTDWVGVSLDGTVDTGGITVSATGFSGPVSSARCLVKTPEYNSAVDKLDVKAEVGLGGITLQQSIQRFPGIEP